MSKKYEISTEAQVLLKLLRIALGTEPMGADGTPVEPFPQAIDWREVIRLSYEQKVSALAVDGLKASGYDPREGKSGRQLEELNAVLKPWFEDVKNTEDSYSYYHTVLSTLCQIFSANGIRTIILKGYGLSLNYPVPCHRRSGDIDIFLIDKDGKPAAERGDEIIRQFLNLNVTRNNGTHHSAVSFKGIAVENHYELRGPFLKTDAEKIFYGRLKELVMKDIVPIEYVAGAYSPSPTFNALYLMRHMIGNLSNRSINFRQMMDWVTFIRIHGDDVDWKLVEEIQKDARLFRFASDMKAVITKAFYPEKVSSAVNNDMIDKLLAYIVKPTQPGRTIIRRLTFYYRNRWMTRYLFDENWRKLLAQAVKRCLKRIAPRTHAACSRKSA